MVFAFVPILPHLLQSLQKLLIRKKRHDKVVMGDTGFALISNKFK